MYSLEMIHVNTNKCDMCLTVIDITQQLTLFSSDFQT